MTERTEDMDTQTDIGQIDPDKLAAMRAAIEPTPSAAKTPEPPSRQQQAEAAIVAFCHQLCTVMLRGAVGSLPQAPGPIVTVLMARAMGEVISAGTSVGIMGDCLKIRGDAVHAFTQGVRRHDIRPPATPPGILGRR